MANNPPSNKAPLPENNKKSLLQAELKIFGLVQGVFFRDFARTAAAENNIKGWVKNAADGTVEALAQGTPDDLQKFTSECQNGPVGSRVDKIDTKMRPIEKVTFEDFAVLF